MGIYEGIAKKAVEQYSKLPQECDPLYRKHFIPMPFELKDCCKAAKGAKAMGRSLNNTVKTDAKGFEEGFDAVLGSAGYAVSGDHLNIKTVDELRKEDIEKRMHSSSDDKYAAFVDAYSRHVVFIDVPAGRELSLRIRFINSFCPLNTQIFVNAGKGSKLRLFEAYSSAASARSSLGVVHDINIGIGAQVELDCVHTEDKNTVAIGLLNCVIGERSSLKFNSVYCGDLHTRVKNDIVVGDSGSAVVNEVAIGSDTERFDIGTRIANGGRRSSADLTSKAVLAGGSRCLFKGLARIEHGAAASRSDLLQRGMLIGGKARFESLPDMFIEESEVDARHSSATLPLDEEAIFYLMSKGISRREAATLIVGGFLSDCLAGIEDAAAKEAATALLKKELQGLKAR
jgi:Fe-S cluster assembly protein SufD